MNRGQKLISYHEIFFCILHDVDTFINWYDRIIEDTEF